MAAFQQRLPDGNAGIAFHAGRRGVDQTIGGRHGFREIVGGSSMMAAEAKVEIVSKLRRACRIAIENIQPADAELERGVRDGDTGSACAEQQGMAAPYIREAAPEALMEAIPVGI